LFVALKVLTDRMELTLNLLWLLLAIPAIWIGRGASCEGLPGQRQSLRRLLILGCVLMVLFPVVSATDDLQAMRPEMEEAGTRDGLGTHHGRLLVSPGGLSNTFALVAARFLLRPESAVWTKAEQTSLLPPGSAVVTTRAGRAPPPSLLG
jgi:hypothetical protein